MIYLVYKDDGPGSIGVDDGPCSNLLLIENYDDAYEFIRATQEFSHRKNPRIVNIFSDVNDDVELGLCDLALLPGNFNLIKRKN